MQTYSISMAKARLPELRRAALIGEEFLVKNDKENQSDYISIIATQVLDEVLSALKFTHEWVKEEGDEVWTLIVPEIDIFGIGETKEEAIKSLSSTASEYADLFFKNLPMYMSDAVNRRQHYGYLRRIVRCEGDEIKIREVLGF